MIFHKLGRATAQSLPTLFGLLIVGALAIGCSDDTTESPSPIGAAGSTAGTGAAGGGAPIAGTAAVSGGVSGAAGSISNGAAGTSGRFGGSGRSSGASGTGAAAPMPVAGTAAGSAAGSGGTGGGVAGGGAGASGMSAAGQGGAAGQGMAGAGGEYQPCPANEVCRILPFGDSITYGIGFNGGYRVELFRLANKDGKKITFTGSVSNGPTMVDGVMFPRNNEGHSGWKIDQLLPLVPTPALQPVPHIVLLMIGTNDIAQNDNLMNAPKRLGGLIDKIAMNAPDALIVVAQLTPLSRSMAVQTYNAALPAIVQERAAAGRHVILVDQFTGFPTAELGDGVHPNEAGYKRMAGVWYKAIGPLLR